MTRAAVLALALLASGCGATLAQSLATAQTQAAELRKTATAALDPVCLAAAKACPPRPAACPAYDACDATRHRIYQAASTVQLSIRSVALIAALDETQGLALLPGLLAQAARLLAEVRAIWADATPASQPGGGS